MEIPQTPNKNASKPAFGGSRQRDKRAHLDDFLVVELERRRRRERGEYTVVERACQLQSLSQCGLRFFTLRQDEVKMTHVLAKKPKRLLLLWEKEDGVFREQSRVGVQTFRLSNTRSLGRSV